MPKKTLNALFVKNVKPDPMKVVDFSDQEIDHYGAMRRGFLFRVSPRGLKTWVARLKYSDGPKTGYYYETKVGSYPAMQLSEARSIFDQWRHFGIPEAKITMDKLCDRYLDEHSKINKASWYEDERMIKVAVRPAIGSKSIDEVTKQDVRDIIGKVKDRGAVNAANIHLAVIRKLFNFAIDVDLLEANPCYRIKPFQVPEPHRPDLNDTQLKTFLTQLPTATMPETIRQILMLQLQTASRISEVRGLRWDEIDLEHGVWTLPAHRCKTRTKHRVMLSRQSIQLVQGREGNGSDYVFPQVRSELMLRSYVSM